MGAYECQFCHRVIKSERGLVLHQSQNECCLAIQKSFKKGRNLDGDSKPICAGKSDNVNQHLGLMKQKQCSDASNIWRPSKIRQLLGDFGMHKLLSVAGGDEKRLSGAMLGLKQSNLDPKQHDKVYQTLNALLIGNGLGKMQQDSFGESNVEHDDTGSLGDDIGDGGEDFDSVESEADEVESVLTAGADNEDPDEHDDRKRAKRRQEKFEDFKRYVEYAKKHFIEFTDIERASVRLMHKLIKKKAPLDTYDVVMEWHLQERGVLGPDESVGGCDLFISRQKLMEKLRRRYHMSSQYASPCTISLPHSKSKVTVWKKDARDNVLSLLTNPRWTTNDWLYFDDDPFAAPPDNLSYVGDLNTGEAYLETYKRLITKERQILVALPLYIDGAVTGQINKLQVTALKMSIGILNRHARDREHGWRNLGFITNYTKEDTHGRNIFINTGHVSALERYCNECEDDQDENEQDIDK